jgi:hypothetical protein
MLQMSHVMLLTRSKCSDAESLFALP